MQSLLSLTADPIRTHITLSNINDLHPRESKRSRGWQHIYIWTINTYSRSVGFTDGCVIIFAAAAECLFSVVSVP